ncbi:MAG: HlyC/CorC family transporter [Proteobacteria bacterium]|nr:HlyC/CorC family transporter [Pseudomonadota bacterium]
MYFFDLAIIFLLIIANGILAMTEFAIVSSNRHKMNRLAKTNQGAKVAIRLMDKPGEFLSTVQIGITIIGIISGAFSGQRFAEPLGLWLNEIQWVYGYGELIAFSLIVMFVTYVSLVIGELIPKRIALSKPEKIASLCAPLIYFLSKLTHPFVIILNFSTNILLKLFSQKEIKDSCVTEEEIHSLLERGFEEGAIDAFKHHIFQRVLKFGERDASIIMTPRIKTVALNLNDDLSESKNKILSNPHRYYPVFETNMDNPIGIVDVKDILTQQMKGQPFDLKSLVKEAPYVVEDTLGPDLLEHFKARKIHMAVVVDEYGVMQGMVTLVDLFETLVGEVPESQAENSYKVVQREDGSWLCDGLTPIDDIEELLKRKIILTFEEDDFNTLAGFLLVHFKRIPNVGESIYWNSFKFEIVDLDGKRIDKVLIKKIKEEKRHVD